MRSSCSKAEECPTCRPEMPSEMFANGCMTHTDQNRRHDNPAPVFHPEFGRFMLEATPGKPWGIGFKDLLDVEPNMKWR
jgi:glutamate--cysteine ligase catalytic subunit